MQPSQYGLNFAGPFLGLNTVQAPHALSPAFAVAAENVLITRAGGVRPRDPWRRYWRDGILGYGAMITGMLHLDISKLAGLGGSILPQLRVLAKLQTGKLYQYSAFGRADQQLVDLSLLSPLSDAQPTWVLANRRLYVIDGSARMVQYDGDTVRTIGIDAPTVAWVPQVPEWPNPPAAQVEFKRVDGSSGPDAGLYAYTATFYDSVYGIESNATFDPPIKIVHDGTSRVEVRLTSAPLGQGIDSVRIYRRHISGTDGEELGLAFRLIGELPLGESPSLDDVPDDEVTLSDDVTGPFAPTRNGFPPAARIAAWYKDRMWYADPDDGTRLWYSEHSFPEHVGSTSFLRIGGDSDDVITGMVEMAGQVVILKKGGPWILSGDLETYDNTKVALGSLPGIDFAESFPEVYKSKAKIGCHSSGGGNGVIVCGEPPFAYFSNAAGLYRFDGVDARLVSDLIRDDWSDMLNAENVASETDHSISYAVDLVNQVLYVCPLALRTSNPFPQKILCYHWAVDRGDGVGVWTTITNAGETIPPPGPDFLDRLGIACIATCLGSPSALGFPYERVGHVSPLLVAGLYQYTSPFGDATFYSELLHAETDASEEDVPVWLWRTGDLMLAGGKKAHAYYLEYRHERATPEVGGGPTVKVRHSLDGGALTDLGPVNGQGTKDVFMRRLQLGRTGRSLALEFTRGNVTKWEAWKGLTGFAVDVELAEQR